MARCYLSGLKLFLPVFLGILTTRGKKDNFPTSRIRLSLQSDYTLLDISIFLDTLIEFLY